MVEHWYQITSTLSACLVGWLMVSGIRQARKEQRQRVIAETSSIPNQEKGLLDFGAGIEESIHATTVTVNQIEPYMVQLGRVAARDWPKVGREKTFVGKRNRAAKMAEKFDNLASKLSPQVSALESAANVLSESWPEYLDIAVNPVVDLVHGGMAASLLRGVNSALPDVERLHETIGALRGGRTTSRRVHESLINLMAVLERLMAAMRTTRTAAEVVTANIRRRSPDAVRPPVPQAPTPDP